MTVLRIAHPWLGVEARRVIATKTNALRRATPRYPARSGVLVMTRCMHLPKTQARLSSTVKRSELKRKTRIKRSWIRRKPRPNKYNTRPRDLEYMGFVKALRCCRCGGGPCEAHHSGDRAYSRKAEDRTCIPLCEPCHTGISKLNEFLDKAARREWIDEMIAQTQSLFLAEKGAL